MGGVLSLGGSAASIATTASCCMCSSAMAGCNQAGKASKKASAIIYVLLVFLSAILGLIMKTWGANLVIHLPGAKWGCTDDWCHGNESVYRVSFGVVIFFGICMIVAPVCDAFHSGMWGVKCILLPATIFAAYMIPAPFYYQYEEVSRVASSLFLLLQVLILIEFAYDSHEWLVTKADDADEGQEPGMCSNGYRVLYISLCVLFTLGSVISCCFMYHYFSCGAGPASVSVTLLGVIIFSIVSVSEWGRGLLVGSVVSAYITWLEFSAMTSMPQECNPFLKKDGDEDATSVWLGLIIASLSVGYAGYSAATGVHDALSLAPDAEQNNSVSNVEDDTGGDNDRVYQLLAEGKTDESETTAQIQRERNLNNNGTEEQTSEEKDSSAASSVAVFHFVMVCCGFYMAMVLTNWADTPDKATPSSENGTSSSSMWVKLLSQYATMALYMWSIFAPLIMTDREF